MGIRIEKLSKRFGETTAVADITFEVRPEELFFLLGPSGCGKTTLLRVLAGFYQPDQGEIWFGEKRMNGVPPHQRNTGMVFQHYALWPHLTVAQNVAYGLEVRAIRGAAKAARVSEALEIVQMGAYAQRLPNQLSGGQQQRVALARALVIRPEVLLLDEPLSNLDAKLRLELREEIRRIHAQTRITTVYVTHDQKEALSLADRLAVLRDGRVEQLGSPREVYRAPANRFVADFMGETNWLAGHVVERAPGSVSLETGLGRFDAATTTPFSAGEAVWLGFRPEAVQIGADPVSARGNTFEATIEQASYLGEIEQYGLRTQGELRVKAFEQNPPARREVGARVTVRVRAEDRIVLLKK